jgi:hypothetical protein
MRKLWIVVYAFSLLIGLVAWRLAPETWRVEPQQAILFGAALYFGALHRYTMRMGATDREISRGGGAGIIAGLAARTSLFLAIAGLQAYSCYEWLPGADVRGGFVLTATWLVALALIDTPRRAREPVGSS